MNNFLKYTWSYIVPIILIPFYFSSDKKFLEVNMPQGRQLPFLLSIAEEPQRNAEFINAR